MANATFDTTTRQLIITDDDGRRLAASLDVPEGQTLAAELDILRMAPGVAGWQTADRRNWWCYVTPLPAKFTPMPRSTTAPPLPPLAAPFGGTATVGPDIPAVPSSRWTNISGTELVELLTRFAARNDVAAALSCGEHSEANLHALAERFLAARGFPTKAPR